jgi:hypothetical protein
LLRGISPAEKRLKSSERFSMSLATLELDSVQLKASPNMKRLTLPAIQRAALAKPWDNPGWEDSIIRIMNGVAWMERDPWSNSSGMPSPVRS